MIAIITPAVNHEKYFSWAAAVVFLQRQVINRINAISESLRDETDKIISSI
jgi:hypothetical protein